MENENMFLLYALLMGIFITFLYDILRILRRIVRHRDFLVSLEDIAFWIYCAAEVFLLMHRESDGTLRWFAVLGALAGMMTYRKLVSPFLVKYVSLALQKVFGLLGKIGKILLKPLVVVARRIRNAFARLSAKAATKLAHRKRRQENRSQKRILKKKLTYLLKVLKMMM